MGSRRSHEIGSDNSPERNDLPRYPVRCGQQRRLDPRMEPLTFGRP